MKKLMILILAIFLMQNVQAAMLITPDIIKERYQYDIDYEADTLIVNKDDYKCNYFDFATGNCEDFFYWNNFCVQKNELIWENLGEHCCAGLESSSKSMKILGQPRCISHKNVFERLLDFFFY